MGGRRQVAFAQVDHTPVPLFLIPHFGGDGVEVEAHRYPFAGQANVTLRLGVVAADGGPVRWLAAGDLTDRYLARVHWTPDGLLLLQVQSRDQTRLEVRRVNPTTGETRTLWVEDCRPWINPTDDLTFVQVEGAADADYTILWSSERTGRRELYLYDRDGAPLHQITRARVLIDGVRGVDAAGGWVYYDGWRETPLERHLFRSPWPAARLSRSRHEAGAHLCVLAKDCSAYVDVYDSVTAPPTATIRAIGGAWSARLQPAAVDARVGALALRPPDFITVTTRDGVTLHGAVYRPPAVAPGSKAPVVVSVYGGPHAQRVANTWALTADLRAQYYAQQGFVVVRIDNRGSARRGLAFEGAIHRNMGAIEVQDQADGVRALADLIPEADLDRVGVYGWSYGGYMALMCLARAPELFKAGIAGAPVTHWDGYDTHYTERYMGTPADNPEGYRISSVMAHVEAVRGRLLLVHGMIDENVHFRHTGRLLTALIRARVPYELQLFPAERHTPRREEDRVFMEQRMAAFLQQCLRQ
ncbi:MAG: prolyl oligopeptidase family serine peptidase [Dehalococcoidia bacterium]